MNDPILFLSIFLAITSILFIAALYHIASLTKRNIKHRKAEGLLKDELDTERARNGRLMSRIKVLGKMVDAYRAEERACKCDRPSAVIPAIPFAVICPTCGLAIEMMKGTETTAVCNVCGTVTNVRS